MNSNDNDTPLETATAPPAEGEEGAAPKRKRAPRKTAAAVEAGETTEAAPAAGAGGEVAEAAPKRRAPRKKVAEAAAEAAPAEALAAADVAPALAVAAPVEAAAPTAAGVDAGDAGESAEASGAEGEGGDAADAGDERGGRRRNRRRGRNRGEGGEAGDGAEGGGNGERVQRNDAAPAEPAPELLAAVGERFAEVLSGSFDAEGEAAAAPVAAEAVAEQGSDDDEEGDEDGDDESRRVLAPEPDAPKLQKVLAQAGVGSRRDIENMIADGKIEVNGDVAHIGQRISFGDRVSVNGKPIKVRIQPPAPRILAYHKPTGEVVTFNDPEGRPTVFRHLPRLQHGKWQSVGRLDINTEGLLLFTNSGELANQLMHPRFGVEREYAARVLGTLNDEQRQRLLAGVDVDGQQASFKSIEDGGGEGVNRWYRVTITEGRNREVRKLFEAVGMAVSRLIRIRYGTVVLPRGLRRGVYVELGDDDVRVIRRLTGFDRLRGGDGERGERNDRGGNNRNDRDNKQGGGKNRGRSDRNANSGPRPSRPEAPRQEPQQRQPERDRYQGPRDDDDDGGDDDFMPRNINPLEQTFDRRFATGAKRGFPSGFGAGGSGAHGTGAPGRGNHKPNKGGGGGGGPKQPDPMQTSMGYIGADAFQRRRGGGGGGGHGGGGGGRGGRGGGRSR
ncbi:MAG: pseudouridine synthase [Pelomonas sp.]|nr:pseudouridine synthase [Roseateles sp.]